MGRGRIHSRDLKLLVVRQIASGEKRPAQVCRDHGLTETRGEAAFTLRESSGAETVEQRIAELERFCGQLALENAALKKTLSLSRSRSDTR